jgi:hypothetical protein
MQARLLFGAMAATMMLVAGTAAAAGPDRDSTKFDKLSALRSVTAVFHGIAAAEQHNYALLTDAARIACIAMPGIGGMGVHWANTTLVGDPAIDADHPEALVYAPSRDGTLRLAAIEYVVLQAAWDATHDGRPSLFGHAFNLTDEPNRFGSPAFYSLHVWAWQHNPAGTFEMFHPRLSCHDTRLQ